ncbi:GTP cyclohydrolase II RibA [Lacibacterium aquatile]|uniref:GTP cyclohydrolase-2 n=1 Tax=Lacibacterium aquatile TaxID=1168082 RepID=A0ABW5DLF7_9PROT
MSSRSERPSFFSGLDRNRRPIEVQRALAEVRAGRPVRIIGADRERLVASAELADLSLLQDMRSLSSEVSLVMAPPRLSRLGITSDIAMRMPVADNLALIADLIAAPQPRQPAAMVSASVAEIAGLELMRLALLLPALVAVEVQDEQRESLGGLLSVSVDAIIAFRSEAAEAMEIVSRARVPLVEAADAEFVVFRGGDAQRDQVAILIGNPDPSEPVDVRLHSACLTGDLFGSLRCDCGDQLRRAVGEMAERGGVLLYLDQEGRGTGIATKMRAYGLQDEGLDTVEADALLGYGVDERRYDVAAQMLKQLGFQRVALMTNNPDKVAALRQAGLEIVSRTAIFGAVTAQNRRYLNAKATKAGHMLGELALGGD